MPTIANIGGIVFSINYIIHKPDDFISELSFDSRKITLPACTLFFAIKTEKNDGHQYIPQLIKNGVRNFIITDSIDGYDSFDQCNFIQVENAIAAMQNLAIEHRKQFTFPVIGITGSNGKTIVKEWLSEMLSPEYQVAKNPNSYNSQIGVPFSVWQLSSKHNIAIFEAGISKPDEMEKLEKIICPTWGILTNIGSAHSEFFHDQQEKLVEKLKLFKNAHCLVYCNDNLQIADELKKDEYAAIRKFSWGSQPDSYFKIGSKVVSNHHTLVEVNGQNIDIPFTDAASYENALNATAMLFLMGYSFQQVNHKLSQLTPVNMRLEIKEAINQSIIINDTYSLDLYSLRIALDFLHSQTQLSKKTLIISDFEQVGRLNEQDYREIGNLIEKNQINKMIAVGNDFYAHRTLFSVETQYFYQKTNDLIADIDRIGLQQEVVLIKGARSFGFEKLVNLLQCKTHQTVLNVNLSAIIHNLNYYRNLIKPSTKMVAVVKAMSYGLGDAELINELIYHHIDYLAVAYTDEGIRLRNRNIKTPIIVLGAEAHSFEMMIRYSLEPEIYNFYYLEQLGNILALHPDIKSFNIHIKLDTGMHRLGFNEKDISRLVNLISATPKLKIASIFSHLAAAEDEKEDTFTLSQIALFDRMSTKIKSHFQYPILRHILNSAGISRFPEAQFDMVRLGIGLYGFSGVQKDIPYLQHAATLKTIITQIKTIEKGATIGYNRSYRTEKEMKIAIIPIGYADGYPRELSNGVGQVLVHHTLVSIVGKICMDMCMIDVTGLDVSEGDEVIVYGSENSIATIAERTHRIPYEFLTSISPRVPRIYVME